MQIELYSEEPKHIEQSRKAVMEDVRGLKNMFLFSHPEYKPAFEEKVPAMIHDEKKRDIRNFFDDLEDTAYWHALGYIDGVYRHHKTFRDYLSIDPKKELSSMTDRRMNARDTFTERELEKILNICINQALLIPLESYRPANQQGHRILYEDLVQKPGSIYKKEIPREFIRRLNNGRFWEDIPLMSEGLDSGLHYFVVDDVLTKNYDDLDLDFVGKGIGIFNRVRQNMDSYNLHELSDKGVANYAKFIKTIDDNLRDLPIKTKDLQYLVAPYALELMQFNDTDIPSEEIRFKNMKERKKLFRQDFLKDYLGRNDYVRDKVARKLSYALINNTKDALDFLAVIPNKPGMIKKITENMEKEDILQLGYDLKDKGINPKYIFA